MTFKLVKPSFEFLACLLVPFIFLLNSSSQLYLPFQFFCFLYILYLFINNWFCYLYTPKHYTGCVHATNSIYVTCICSYIICYVTSHLFIFRDCKIYRRREEADSLKRSRRRISCLQLRLGFSSGSCHTVYSLLLQRGDDKI